MTRRDAAAGEKIQQPIATNTFPSKIRPGCPANPQSFRSLPPIQTAFPAMKKALLLASAFLFLNAQLVDAQKVSVKNLKKHIAFLASDALHGRGTGTDDERLAADYIAAQFEKAGLAPHGNNGTWFNDFEFHKSTDPHGTVSADGPLVHSRNVCGYLDNGAATTVVVGAHYDHLGLGHDHNSLDANPDGKIHNGADDNASGTAAVIELARLLASNKLKEKHNYFFICFSGEELGLIGSKKFTENPSLDLKTVDFMVNMDMVGRLNEEKPVLVVGGVGTSPTWVPTIEALPHPDFSIKKDSAGVGPSDHTSFYLMKMPVLFVFTGQHKDYHKPSDDIDKINFKGEKAVLKWLYSLLMSVEKTQTERLVFQETKSSKEDTPSFKVTLGIMPDYTWEGTGVHIDGVTEGKPASKAGLQKGDIIRKLGDVDVTDIHAYMKGLAMFKKGDTTTVIVERMGKFSDYKVTF